MAKKKKGIPVIYIILVIAVVLTIGLVVYKHSKKEEANPKTEVIKQEQEQGQQQVDENPYAAKAKTADDIQINEDDPDEVKVEKIQGKLELMNKEINKKQAVLETETEVLNKLYEEYVSVMNENITEIPTEE